MGNSAGRKFIVIIIVIILIILGFSYYMGGEKDMETVTQAVENPIKGKDANATQFDKVQE